MIPNLCGQVCGQCVTCCTPKAGPQEGAVPCGWPEPLLSQLEWSVNVFSVTQEGAGARAQRDFHNIPVIQSCFCSPCWLSRKVLITGGSLGGVAPPLHMLASSTSLLPAVHDNHWRPVTDLHLWFDSPTGLSAETWATLVWAPCVFPFLGIVLHGGDPPSIFHWHRASRKGEESQESDSAPTRAPSWCPSAGVRQPPRTRARSLWGRAFSFS